MAANFQALIAVVGMTDDQIGSVADPFAVRSRADEHGMMQLHLNDNFMDAIGTTLGA